MTANYSLLNADYRFYLYKLIYILCPNDCYADNTNNLVANYFYLLTFDCHQPIQNGMCIDINKCKTIKISMSTKP